jgi:hypothetical protein
LCEHEEEQKRQREETRGIEGKGKEKEGIIMRNCASKKKNRKGKGKRLEELKEKERRKKE